MKFIHSHLQKSGLLILDAHLNPWDILLTARHFRKKHQATILMPIAGYVFYVPIIKEIVAWFAKKYQIRFLPVYRKEELTSTNRLMKFLCWFYPSQITQASHQKANQLFVTTATKACQKPSHVVIVAPYGSPLWFGRSIKSGVEQIMLSRVTFAVSQTKWSWSKFWFITKLGKINRTNKIKTSQDLQNLVKQEFESLL